MFLTLNKWDLGTENKICSSPSPLLLKPHLKARPPASSTWGNAHVRHSNKIEDPPKWHVSYEGEYAQVLMHGKTSMEGTTLRPRIMLNSWCHQFRNSTTNKVKKIIKWKFLFDAIIERRIKEIDLSGGIFT
jgi:hypothetical protein